MVTRMVYLIWSATFILTFAVIALAAPARKPVPWLVCPDPLLGQAIQIGDSCDPLEISGSIGVIEGNEVTFNIALKKLARKGGSYIAVLFYASWCPFSKLFRPNFQALSSMFPSVEHFAFDESLIRPNVLSRYGVHGFPTLFLLNETTSVRYRGPQTIDDLVAFYNDVTGFVSLDLMSVETNAGTLENAQIGEDSEPESFPLLWARSPEKLLQQDTYLALASCFLILRLLSYLLPKVNA